MLVDIVPPSAKLHAMIARGKGAFGDKSLLDILDAPAALWSAADKAALANYCGKPAIARTRPNFRRKIHRDRRSGNAGIPAHFDELHI